jgi:outer membrane protein OmpA-like peptidoglycan-associated protein
VGDFLKERGISSARLQVNGYGSRLPLVPNNTEENRALNRRIDFRVIE